MDKLFTYGILQDPPVIHSIIGRLPPSVPAVLADHVSLQVSGASYPGLRLRPGSSVAGTLYFGLSHRELMALDVFEGSAYERIQVAVCTDVEPLPVTCWVYYFKDSHAHLLTDNLWTLEVQRAKGAPFEGLVIKINPYEDPVCAPAIVDLLNHYASSTEGGGQGLSAQAASTLLSNLRSRPWMVTWVALLNQRPVGLLIAVEGFSTFAGKPLFNIHDVVVHSAFRRRGIAKALFQELECYAVAKGACKLTLEVLSGNTAATHAYQMMGFTPYQLDPALGTAGFWHKLIN